MSNVKAGKNKNALITGASSGIGESLAECFAKGGFNLILVARGADKLQLLADRLAKKYDVQTWISPVDLSISNSAAELADEMKKLERPIDVLVNCAGILEHGEFIAIPASQHQGIIDLNISSLTAMLSHFLPPMVNRGSGKVLNVASVAAFQPVPSLATYAASKAYVLSLTESLSEELKDTGVTISALCPGITATNMMSTATAESANLKVPDIFVGDADQVAAEGYASLMKGDVIKVPGIVNQASILASRATPKWLVRKVWGKLGRTTIKSK